MKILYRQTANSGKGEDALSRLGISKCYFKSIRQVSGSGSDAKKRHSHTGFEFHIMIEGEQRYETEGGSFLLESGRILAIPRGVPHWLAKSSYPIKKYAFTFAADGEFFDTSGITECRLLDIPERILSNIHTAETLGSNTAMHSSLTENIVLETLYILLCRVGAVVKAPEEGAKESVERGSADERVELAVQFIKDNCTLPLQVGEVASYCYISEKQLNRLFLRDVGASVAEFIRRERLLRLEELLSSTDTSLSEISDRFGFPCFHGFCIFFKKYNGMAPGEYRRMTGGGKT